MHSKVLACGWIKLFFDKYNYAWKTDAQLKNFVFKYFSKDNAVLIGLIGCKLKISVVILEYSFPLKFNFRAFFDSEHN